MKCFYHNDLDGRCAGSIVAKFTNNYNPDDYFEVDYVQSLPLDKVRNKENVYFVDYSFKPNTISQLDSLLSKNCNVVWIDHHTSSLKLELTKGYEWTNEIKGIRQDGISGAALTYMYLYDCKFEGIPTFIKLVSDYDCWQYKFEPNTTYFKLGIETVPDDALDNIWTKLSDKKFFDIVTLNDLIDKGKTVKKYVDETNKYYREHFAYESEIDGHKCLVVNQKTNSWVFGEKYNEYPLVMIWVFDGTKYVYSIFSSNQDIKCNEIASKYDKNGGGHKGAAGFSSDELLFKKV